MICLIALVVFGILGIFSATHRKIAAQAFDCVFRKMTLRPCQSGLDQRLRIGIIGTASRKSPKLARFISKHFEILSWAFTILMIVSMIYSVIGAFNFVVYGNCNGESSQAFCIYNGLGNSKIQLSCGSPLCQNTNCTCEDEIKCQEAQNTNCTGSCFTT